MPMVIGHHVTLLTIVRSDAEVCDRHHRYFAATGGSSVVQHDVQQSAANFQAPVIVNEAQLAESIHKETDAGARGAYDLSQGFMAHLGEHRFQSVFFAKTSQQQKSAGQPFLGGVKELIDQVGLNLAVADD